MLAIVAQQLATALRSSPCRCTRRWNKEKPDGFEITHLCSRCVALHAYDNPGPPTQYVPDRLSDDPNNPETI
jgi:hypothetical protein